jgi:hypothetical protein
MGDPANHAISEHLERWIERRIPRGATILELGSGHGTLRLAARFRMVSVEHDERFIGLAPATYIHAPIVPFSKQCASFPTDVGWYSRDVLRAELPRHRYDLLLVDGPPNSIGRGGFYKWRALFDLTVPIVVDDIHRERERKMIGLLSRELGRPYIVYAWERRHFGVIES